MPPKAPSKTSDEAAPAAAPKDEKPKRATRHDYNDSPAPSAPPKEAPQAKPIRITKSDSGATRIDY